MKFRIFILAFSVGFVFCFTAAVLFVFSFSGTKTEEPETEDFSEAVFLEETKAVFLLVYESENGFGPFTLINFDAEAGRIPVFTFSGKAAINYGGNYVSAGDLFSSVSPGVFAGTIEKNFGIELSGYFIWNRESAEKIISKAGTFDYVLPENISYSSGNKTVNLSSGIQNMTGKKICDIFVSPKFSEGERCDAVSRITAAFINRRLRRLLPGRYPMRKQVRPSPDFSPCCKGFQECPSPSRWGRCGCRNRARSPRSQLRTFPRFF